MKNLAVYGAGNYGKKVVNILEKTTHIHIELVCDSDARKWGKDFEGHKVCSPDELFKKEDLDGVFVAILADNEIEKFILEKRKIEIYKHIYELVAETITWDISGKCNAKCKYCVTGRNNRFHGNDNKNNTYTSLKEFKRSYQHLYERGIISKKSELQLFNWKEPFLNPEIVEILNYCSQESQKYILSTNASIVRFAVDKNTYLSCERIYFSMPGFSQKSYDQIHGFSFDVIKNNIILLKNDMLEHGFKGQFVINAHIYKFSEKELDALKDWAEKNDLLVHAYYPYLAGNSLIEDYFENRLDSQSKQEISADLFLQWDKEIDQKELCGFTNPLCDQLAIDEKGNFTLCCAADEFCECFTGWGKVEDTNSYEDYRKIKRRMLDSKTCIQCRKYEMVYRMLHELPVL